MVEELHRRGFHGFRIYTQIHQGIAYRIYIFPQNLKNKDNHSVSEKTIFETHPGYSGLDILYRNPNLVKIWSNGMPSIGFTEEWKFQENWSVEWMASYFLRSFAEISELSNINNNAYKNWFSRLLPQIKNGSFPVFIDDTPSDDTENTSIANEKLKMTSNGFVDWPPESK